jgi:glycosyltransferase involved in cell wall biosynthesis
MRVALVHDYIKEYGGAERVLEALHEIWPEAPVYTTVYLPQFLGPHRVRFADWDIVTSGFQKLPFVGKLISPLRILSPWVFENWDFSGFDAVIISATGAYFPNLIMRRPETLHICYCHTPPRYLYGYPTARNWKKNPVGRVIGELINHNLRQVDFVAGQRPDYFIANSMETKRRIAKFYRRDSAVIYPPVELENVYSRGPAPVTSLQGKRSISIKGFTPTKSGHPDLASPLLKSNNYYLAGGRLARPKHIELAIEACNKLKLPLKIFGKPFADYGAELERIAGPTVEFLGEVSDEELTKLYIGAKALIYPSEQEDFGIIPVEAQSYGIPVVGLNQAGVKETVIDGKTGVLFDELTVGSLIKAIKQLSKSVIKEKDCINNAGKFSKERFKREIEEFVKSKLSSSKI